VIPWETVGRGRAPDGGELVLYRRGGEFVIRVDGAELMSSRAHGSEEKMAEIACAGRGSDARVLIGGLGMGYTLRATLDALPAGAKVVVAEIVKEVVEWNRGPLAPLTGGSVTDPRVSVELADVAAVLRGTKDRWDAVMLDVDNGPQALTRKANHVLYGEPGLAMIKGTLRRGGLLAVWSADPDKRFVGRLRKAGFQAETVDTPARGKAGGPMHTIFVGRV
jgi:spermidine synthase